MAFKSVLDPAFKYRTALSTNIRETFERIRQEQRLDQHAERRRKVVPIIHAERRRNLRDAVNDFSRRAATRTGD